MKRKNKWAALPAVYLILAFCLLLCGCGSDADGQDETSDKVKANGYDYAYTDRELDPSYDEKTAMLITLADDGITVNGKLLSGDTDAEDGSSSGASSAGVSAEGSILTITAEGTYLLSGRLTSGQIVVETPDDEKVQLVLDGVTVANSGSAPLLIRESDKVFVTLAPGSTNVLTGPAAYSETAAADGIDGVIFSKADLCINGSGSLEVTASTGHGIVSKDDLVVTGGDVTVTAPGDGLQGKDCVKIKDGSFVINAENDGIRSSNSEDTYRGFVSIDGGTFSLTAGYDGIQAETVLRVAGGDFSITTGGGSTYASTQSDWGASWGGGMNMQAPGEMMAPGDGMPGDEAPSGVPGAQAPGGEAGAANAGGQVADASSQTMDPGAAVDPNASTDQSGNADGSDSSSADTVSAKGLKGGLGLMILGGALDIDSSDDAIHSNGDVSIEGGAISVSSGDDGIHADANLLIADGTLTISQSYEGIEGNTITMNGGTLDITASDDGLNAAGGTDGSSIDGRAGQDPFAVDESAFIEINGGDLTISASGDGIDSNGSLTIIGGSITISCPTMGDTAVLDYASAGIISGGTFIGTGAVQMAQSLSPAGQGVIAVSVGEQTTGSAITLTDKSGNVIISHETSQSFTVVILSSPDIVSGETYTLTAGSASGAVVAE